jgi:hypothetical protein
MLAYLYGHGPLLGIPRVGVPYIHYLLIVAFRALMKGLELRGVLPDYRPLGKIPLLVSTDGLP